ncbi:MAG: uroporphyrinogen-III synthase [Bacteroidota bacterium]
MPSVFLSRELRPSSPFHALKQSVEWVIHAQSLLRFESVSLGATPAVDWLFFYSQRGVQFLLPQYSPPPELRLAAIGEATAAALRQAGYVPQFVGQGSPQQVADAFREHAYGQRVGFVQARQSRRSVQQILKKAVEASNWIVYDNQLHPAAVASIPQVDYLVFTSPLNVKAWCAGQSAPYPERFIAIGPTTAAALREAGITNYRVAAAPSESELFHCLLDWENE